MSEGAEAKEGRAGAAAAGSAGGPDARPEIAALRAGLKRVLVARLRLRDVAPESIGDHDPLVGGPLGLDSIDLLDLALGVEETYGVAIGDEEIGPAVFRSIASLADFVAARQAIGAAGAAGS